MPPEQAQLAQRFFKLPELPRLAVLQKAGGLPEDIAALEKGELIDPDKMWWLAKCAKLMIEIVSSNAFIPADQLPLYIMAIQAFALPQIQEDQLLRVELIQIYWELHDAKKVNK